MKNLRIMFIALAIIFSACSNQNQGNKPLPIIGTWQLIKGTIVEKGDTTVTDYTKDQSFIKIISDTHFAFFKHDLSKGKGPSEAFDAGGGTYTLKDSTYTEHLEYYRLKEWEGGVFSFKMTLKKDTLIQSGVEKVESTGINRINTEVYVRLK